MLEKIAVWFGFKMGEHAGLIHAHGAGDHGHTHGVIDASIPTTVRGIWAIKWSFFILAATALLQTLVVLSSGSVALLADTIHNVADATTAIPLWIAFMLARRKPTARFNYGYGRVEDLAGVIIVLIILLSACVAAYESIDRLLHPQPVSQLLFVTLAGIVGFLGNEAVAVLRIGVGREINSAALIADGYHARTDGLTSLAVVIGALGVWLGFPLADPIVGLGITLAIFGIVWQSARSVFTRMLDGVDPSIADEIRVRASEVSGIEEVGDIKARWLGHRLHAEIALSIDQSLPLAEVNRIASRLEGELLAHMPALAAINFRFAGMGEEAAETGGGHHAPDPFFVRGKLADGVLEIVDTPEGERMRLKLWRHAGGLEARVTIDRPGGKAEILPLVADASDHHLLMSALAPQEPHEFDAHLQLSGAGAREVLPFRMVEPVGHHH